MSFSSVWLIGLKYRPGTTARLIAVRQWRPRRLSETFCRWARMALACAVGVAVAQRVDDGGVFAVVAAAPFAGWRCAA